MPFFESRGENMVKVMRWAARVITVCIVGFGLLMLIGSAIGDDTPPNAGIVIFVFFFLPTSAALVLAWKWERMGIIAIIGSVCMGITVFFTAGRNKLPASIMISSPFLIAGFLYLNCWLRTRLLPRKK